MSTSPAATLSAKTLNARTPVSADGRSEGAHSFRVDRVVVQVRAKSN